MKLIEVKRLQLIHKILSANKLVYNKEVGNYDRKKQEGGHVNITIPIRAYNSTSSHSRLVWSKFSVKVSKVILQQRIFVASATALLVSTLIVGVLGGALNSAAASDTFHFATPTTAIALAPVTPVTTPVPVEPVTPVTTPVPVEPVEPVTPVVKPVPVVPASPTPTPVATTLPLPAATVPTTLTFSPLMMPVTQPPQQARTTVNAATPAYDQTQSMPMQAAVNPQNVNQDTLSLAVDTSPEIANMTAAQARNNSRSIMYSSSSLSDKTRNQLFIFAIVATVIGALLFRMSDIGSMTILSKRQLVPVPVKDNSTR